MSDEPGDRRKGPRFAARIRVRFRSIDELVTAYTEDVSHGGLYVTSARQLPPGTDVQLSLELPDGKPPALIPARVSYALDGTQAAAQDRNPGMGVQFLEEHAAALAERIATFVATSVGSGEDEAFEPVHALVVEDSAAVRKQIAMALENAGHRVTTAEHGLEALGKAMREPPDVILSDVSMPVMDGWQLLRLLRARDKTRKVPLIFLTALDSDRDRIRGYELGVDDYVSKPFVAEELVARVMRIVNRTRRERQEGEGKTGMSGDLRQVSLPSLLSFLDAERRSGLLSITGTDGEARISVRQGLVTAVQISEPRAPESLFERLMITLDWQDGRFHLEEGDVDASTGAVGIQMALMEHARRKDEAAR